MFSHLTEPGIHQSQAEFSLCVPSYPRELADTPSAICVLDESKLRSGLSSTALPRRHFFGALGKEELRDKEPVLSSSLPRANCALIVLSALFLFCCPGTGSSA